MNEKKEFYVLKTGILQFDIKWEDKPANKDKITQIILNQKKEKLDWIILPEYTLTGFSMNKKKTELTEDDINYFKDISIKFNVYLTFSGIKNKKNSSLTINPEGKIISDYSKIHLFSYANEDKHYTAGNSISKFKIYDYYISSFICYDLRFSYLFWNNAIDTDIFVVQANFPDSRRDHWITLLKARAIENQSYIIGVNRIGNDPNVSYSGDSIVFGSNGDILLDAGKEEGLFYTYLDLNNLINYRKGFPVLNDRKTSVFPLLEGINDKQDLFKKDNRLLTVKELQNYFRISRTKLWEMTKANEIPSLKIGGDVRYKVSDILDYMAKSYNSHSNY